MLIRPTYCKEAEIAKFQKTRLRLHLDRKFSILKKCRVCEHGKNPNHYTLLVSVELTEFCSCNVYKNINS